MFETYSPGGRMWLIRAWLNGEISTSQRFQEIIFSCATCANCVDHCVQAFKDDLLNIFIAAREEMVNKGVIPPVVRDYLKNIHVYGNPYKLPAEERETWVDSSLIEKYNGQEYLFYVGCVGSYDERARKMAMAVARVLNEAGLSIGILGNREICDGNEVRALGETGLFEFLAKRNVTLFKELGIRKIITLDPHSFNAFKNEYPGLGAELDVYHYTQKLAPLMASGKIELRKLEAKVVFHDSCYLGRHNKEYDAPRKILQSIPGVELVELDQSLKNALCCGGGGGNFFTDIIAGGEESPNRVRVRDCFDCGANIIAVACPQCIKMLEDAVKVEEFEGKLEVMDVAEIVTKALVG
jgi:Fe-S oxidoreductase